MGIAISSLYMYYKNSEKSNDLSKFAQLVTNDASDPSLSDSQIFALDMLLPDDLANDANIVFSIRGTPSLWLNVCIYVHRGFKLCLLFQDSVHPLIIQRVGLAILRGSVGWCIMKSQVPGSDPLCLSFLICKLRLMTRFASCEISLSKALRNMSGTWVEWGCPLSMKKQWVYCWLNPYSVLCTV